MPHVKHTYICITADLHVKYKFSESGGGGILYNESILWGISCNDVILYTMLDAAISEDRFLYYPFKPPRASFYIPENRLNFSTTKGFRTKISMKLVHQYVVIFFNF